MIREIIQWPDPILAKISWPAFPCANQDKLIADLIQTMYHGKGCGLAAVQVGELSRVFVLDVGAGPEIYCNPTWTPWKDSVPVMMDEGCLSVHEPGSDKPFRTMVPRYERINVQYEDQHGVYVSAKLKGLRAQAYQHETEHTVGEIYLNHAPGQREWLRAKLETK